MPYRGLPLAPRDLEAERELLMLSRGTQRRRARAALILVGIGMSLAVSVTAIASIRTPRALHCHHVKIVLQQAEGAPPPPMEWTECVEPHERVSTDLTRAASRTSER